MAVGDPWVTPQIVCGAGLGPRIHRFIELATGSAIYSANLGGFSMTPGEAYGVIVWLVCIVSKIPRIALVILPLQDI